MGKWPDPATCRTCKWRRENLAVSFWVLLDHLAPIPVIIRHSLPFSPPWPLPVILHASSSAVDGALQLPGTWEDVLMLDDDGFNQFIHVCLTGHLVVALWH